MAKTESVMVVHVRQGVPTPEIRSALKNFAEGFGTHTVNSEGRTYLWSDTAWNCGYVTYEDREVQDA